MIPGYHGLIFISCFILKRKAGSSNFYRCALFARKKKKKNVIWYSFVTVREQRRKCDKF